MTTQISVIHPGRVLLEQFIVAHGMSVFRLAKEIGVSPRRIYEIVQGQRAINADIAHRLAHYFGMSERYWLDLQARYNLSAANDVYRKITVNRCLTVAK
jgi:antitoxin HigA-1